MDMDYLKLLGTLPPEQQKAMAEALAGGGGDEFGYTQHLSEDQLRRHLTPFDEKNAILDAQLAQAQALRSRPMQQHSTGMGAGLGVLGKLVRGIKGTVDESSLRGQQQKLMGEKQQDAYDVLRAVLQAKALRGGKNPLDAAQAGASLAAQNPDMAALALPAQPMQQLPQNLGEGDPFSPFSPYRYG